DHFSRLLGAARLRAEALLNRPGIHRLRQTDERFYVVISMQSFKRGMPLLPALDVEHCCCEIDLGATKGLRRWRRWEPEPVGSRFRLGPYLRSLVKCLGAEIETYDSLDGQTLVPYQCVVLRSAWDPLREDLLSVEQLQRSAYRRANGGSSAPALQEEVTPRFVPMEDPPERWQHELEPRLVVRNTFWAVEGEECRELRPQRRFHTTPSAPHA
ncbi:unnamed protein product, partial [Durusdinium trenchii]